MTENLKTISYLAPCGDVEMMDPCYQCGCAPAYDQRSCAYTCGLSTQCEVAALLARSECEHLECPHHPCYIEGYEPPWDVRDWLWDVTPGDVAVSDEEIEEMATWVISDAASENVTLEGGVEEVVRYLISIRDDGIKAQEA